MADSKLADLTADTNPAATDLMYKADSAGTSGTDRKVALNLVGGAAVIAQTVLSATAASITFSSIPSSYESLYLVLSGRSDRAGAASDYILIRFNSDTAANYDYQSLNAAATTVAAIDVLATSGIRSGRLPGATATANRQGSMVCVIPGYARTTFNKTAEIYGASVETAASGGVFMVRQSGNWRSTAAITSVTLLPEFGTNFIAGTVATLYGLRAA